MARGELRIYLGAAPGVGKTYAMLNEGRRRLQRGTDVVVGAVDPHGRAQTRDQLGSLELVGPAARGELDVEALLARHPQVVLVDELARSNPPGARHPRRWQDVEELLQAGIDVVSTVNIQHLASVSDLVERITGVAEADVLPDEVARGAAQVELVDMTPEALRRRMAHGNVVGPDEVDVALANTFRAGNLAALRELALLWVADQVDTGLEAYRRRHGITESWETRERVVVALTGAPSTEHLIRRAARLAWRTHGELVGVHVRRRDGRDAADAVLAGHRQLIEEVGGRYLEVASDDVAAALVDVARAERATQLVVGATGRTRWLELLHGSVINQVLRRSGTIDVHVISAPPEGAPAGLPHVERPRHAGLGERRRRLGWATAVVLLPVATLVMVPLREHLALSSTLLLFLLAVVAVAVVGGTAPALGAAVGGFLLVNWYFTPPLHTWTVSHGENVLALVVYLVTAGIVSSLVATAARRTADATRAAAEAETLAALATRVIDADPLAALVAHLRAAFGLRGVALLRRADDGWTTVVADGDAPASPGQADDVHPVGEGLVLALVGADPSAEDRRVIDAFAANLAAALERQQLHAKAAEAAALEEANGLRAALLQAVSHDLRTPLANVKASVSSLRQPDVAWTAGDVSDFLATIEEETDRLTNLVANLLDMSRLNAHALAPALRPTDLDEVVPAAVASLGPRGRGVVLDVPEVVPAALADPALLERVLANLIDNALAHAPCTHPVRVMAWSAGGRVVVRVVDRGPGIPPSQREAVFAPFQRLGDAAPRSGAGVGLGLAVARGFTQAMGGDLVIEDTPGGGTTMVVDLGAA